MITIYHITRRQALEGSHAAPCEVFTSPTEYPKPVCSTTVSEKLQNDLGVWTNPIMMQYTELFDEAIRIEGAVRRRKRRDDGHGSWINVDFKEGDCCLFGDEEDGEGKTEIIDILSQIRTTIRKRREPRSSGLLRSE